MERSEVIGRINGFLVEEFEVDDTAITPEANMRQTLDLDSLDYIDLVVLVESNFGFKVKAEDFPSIVTFQDFYEYVINRIAQKEAV